MKESVLELWNGNINDLLQSFLVSKYILRTPKSSNCSIEQPWIHSTDSHCIERRSFLFAPKVIKQSDSPCLSDQRVVCVNSLIPVVRSRCTRRQDNVSV